MDREVEWLTATFSELSTETDAAATAFVAAAEMGDLATVVRLAHVCAAPSLRSALRAAVCNPAPPLDVIDYLLQFCPVDRELYLDAVGESTRAVVQRLTYRVPPSVVYAAVEHCIHTQDVWDPNVYWFLTGFDYTSPDRNALTSFDADDEWQEC